jgi:ribosomal-protein-alanine N-acetyltransferase
MTAPLLSTERLRLRPLLKATAQQVSWLRDFDVVRFSEQRHQNHSLSTQLAYIHSFEGRSCLWGIYLIETGQHIGNIGANVDEPNNIADIGIMLGERKLWGKGLGQEAWNVACAWLLDKDGGMLRKLEAGCMKTNEAMHKIIRKSKFAQEGERLNHFIVGGDIVSMLLFGRFR